MIYSHCLTKIILHTFTIQRNHQPPPSSRHVLNLLSLFSIFCLNFSSIVRCLLQKLYLTVSARSFLIWSQNQFLNNIPTCLNISYYFCFDVQFYFHLQVILYVTKLLYLVFFYEFFMELQRCWSSARNASIGSINLFNLQFWTPSLWIII